MNKLLIIIALSILYTGCLTSKSASGVTNKFDSPASLPMTRSYSQVVTSDIGNAKLVFIAGQVPMDTKNEVVGKNDFKAQVEQTFDNVKKAVESAGGKMEHIVKMTYFLTDMPKQLPIVRDVREKYVNKLNPPASTAVQITKLFRDDIFVEIEAIAVVPK